MESGVPEKGFIKNKLTWHCPEVCLLELPKTLNKFTSGDEGPGGNRNFVS